MDVSRIVMLSLTCIFICCAFAGDSYESSKPGNEKPKSEVPRKKGEHSDYGKHVARDSI